MYVVARMESSGQLSQGTNLFVSQKKAQIFYPMTNGLMTWWQILISASQTLNWAIVLGWQDMQVVMNILHRENIKEKRAGECPGEEVASQRKMTL
jgi:hypothetical protein